MSHPLVDEPRDPQPPNASTDYRTPRRIEEEIALCNQAVAALRALDHLKMTALDGSRLGNAAVTLRELRLGLQTEADHIRQQELVSESGEDGRSQSLFDRAQAKFPNAEPLFMGGPNSDSIYLVWGDWTIIATREDELYLVGVYTNEQWAEGGEDFEAMIEDVTDPVAVIDYLTEQSTAAGEASRACSSNTDTV